MSEAMIIRRGGADKKLQTKTIVPSTSQQVITPDSGYDGFESITVSAITPTKAAQTYTPGLQDQTIAAGQWLTEAQTIQGSTNLVAGNIKNGISIFGVTGTYNGEGFDPNGAVLKVITSTNCTILVTGTGYSKTHQQADGFPRSSNANVTEHFFSIPASAFGTITVKATNTYGDNTKTITVDTAGNVYELLCGGINIILNSTFGLQSGYTFPYGLGLAYDSRTKRITGSFNGSTTWQLLFNEDIPVSAYTHLTAYVSTGYADYHYFDLGLRDEENTIICRVYGTSGSITAEIDDVVYPTAKMVIRQEITLISEIVLS